MSFGSVAGWGDEGTLAFPRPVEKLLASSSLPASCLRSSLHTPLITPSPALAANPSINFKINYTPFSQARATRESSLPGSMLRLGFRRDAEGALTDERSHGWRERGGRAAGAEPGRRSDERLRGITSEAEAKPK